LTRLAYDASELWKVKFGEQIQGPKGEYFYPEPIRSVDFDPGGKYLAVGGDRFLRLLQTDTGSDIQLASRGEFVKVLFDRDGKYVAVSDGGRRIMILPVSGGEPRSSVRYTADVSLLGWSPDGKVLVSGGVGTIPIAPGQVKDITLLPLGRPFGRTAVASNDGRYVAIATFDAAVRVFDVSNGAEISALAPTPKRTVEHIESLDFSSDSHRLIPTSFDGNARVMEVANGRELLRIVSPVGDYPRGFYSAVFSPDGRYVATGSGGGKAAVFPVTDPAELVRVPDALPNGRVAFTEDGNWSFIASNRVWTSEGAGPRPSQLDAEPRPLVCDGEVKDWKHFIAHPSLRKLPIALCSPDGRYVATHYVQGWAVVEARTGIEISRWPRLTAAMEPASFDPSSRYLAITVGNEIEIRDIRSKKEVAGLPIGIDAVFALAFSPNGEELIAGTDQGNLKMFQIKGEKQLWEAVQQGRINDLEFSADDKSIVSASADRTARVILAATGQETIRIEHAGPVYQARLDWSGRLLTASGGLAKELVIRRFPATPSDLLDLACGRAARLALRPDEWTNYFGPEPYRATCLPNPVAKGSSGIPLPRR
jgi:WD40 repeat protein